MNGWMKMKMNQKRMHEYFAATDKFDTSRGFNTFFVNLLWYVFLVRTFAVFHEVSR